MPCHAILPIVPTTSRIFASRVGCSRNVLTNAATLPATAASATTRGPPMFSRRFSTASLKRWNEPVALAPNDSACPCTRPWTMARASSFVVVSSTTMPNCLNRRVLPFIARATVIACFSRSTKPVFADKSSARFRPSIAFVDEPVSFRIVVNARDAASSSTPSVVANCVN